MKQVVFLIFCIILFSSCISFTNTSQQDNTVEIRSAVVKIFNTSLSPSYYTPWKMQNHIRMTGSGAIIKDKMILTNAHVVSDSTYIQVQKENSPQKYDAHIVHIGHECDLALLTVDDPDFFTGTTELEFNQQIPALKSIVTTYGYPSGGQRISITEGVTSRIQVSNYIHSNQSSLLMIQTDAAINPGNSGGPVIQDGKIVGIAFQVNPDAKNMGFFIPMPIISFFLLDIEDGRFDGFSKLGIYWDRLENQSFRNYLGMTGDMSGIFISSTIEGGSAFSYLQSGDVILSIDGTPIGNDGSIPFAGGRIMFSHLINKKQVGGNLQLEVLRNKQLENMNIPLKTYNERIVTYTEYEELPRYFIYGGIVFQVLNREYLSIWRNWWYNADRELLYIYSYSELDNLFRYKEEFVIINIILPDPVNTYISNVNYKIVNKVNGKEITRLEDVIEAIKHPVGKFLIIELDGYHSPLVLVAEDVEKANRGLLQKYGIQSDRRLNKHTGYGQE